MKTTGNLLLAGIMAAFCCSIGNAQIIYSNNFALGDAVNISNTPPTVANSYAGGTNAALWNDALGVNDTDGLLANGTDNTTLADSWLLPFTPESGHIYLITATVTFTNDPGNWIGVGFAQNDPTNGGGGRFADSSVNGYDWLIARPTTANEQWFSGPHGTPAAGLASANIVDALGTWTMQLILDTTGSKWTADCYFNGVQFGTSFTFTSNPPIGAVGLTQTTLGAPNSVQYNSFVLTTELKPFITQQPTAAQTLSSGDVYTNAISVTADTNGGPLVYQWYANDAPLVNGGSVSGANTNALVINPISTANQFTNYYVVVTNNYGSATSSLASVTVLTNPVVTIPVASSNSITLFAGTGNYVGSSPTFSVSAVGAPPLSYQWFTNGVAVDGATDNSLAFTNCQSSSPTSYACVVSNSFGQVTNTWFATYVTTPTAAYPQTVLGDAPLDFWRLNEADGTVCDDYQSGNNGVYTNVVLGQLGYNSSEPTETAAAIALSSPLYSYAGHIQGVDFAVGSGTNAEFTVEAWASGFGDVPGSPVVSEGMYGVNEEFGLGSDTNATTMYQFYVRAANGTIYKADSTIPVNDGSWHHLVGVCDEANGKVLLYIDGDLAASATIPAKSGIYEASSPLAIGAGIISGQSDYTLEFNGNISDVAAYDYALSIGQVIGQYAAVPGNSVPVSFISSPSLTNFAYLAGQTLTIPVTVAGSAPFSYYWTNLTDDSVLASGSTNVSGSLDATLTIPNASAGLNGDQLELVVNNGSSSTNLFITLFNPPAPVTLDYSDSILYSNNFLSSYGGATWSIVGQSPTEANVLVGGTNSVWIDSATNDVGTVQASGFVTSSSQDSWTLPFTPHAGYVYTLDITETFLGAPASWIAAGFCQNIVTNGAAGGAAKINGGATSPDGVDWMLWQQNGSVQYFAGPGGTANLANGATATAGNVTHSIQIILDTTGAKWTCHAVVDGHTTATGTYSSIPVISGIVIAQNGAANGAVQWNNIMLTQVAPGGVAPYVYNSVPPASVTLLADSSLSLPVTAFGGSASFGYYWSNTNTAAILGSGTSSAAPIDATLNVADVPYSWNGNTLALVVTNAYGTNISLVSLNVTNAVSLIPTNIVFSVTGNQMTLSWPTDHTGWTLQAQTNALDVGLGTNWVDVPESTSTNQMVIPIDPNNGSVFYRLILQ